MRGIDESTGVGEGSADRLRLRRTLSSQLGSSIVPVCVVGSIAAVIWLIVEGVAVFPFLAIVSSPVLLSFLYTVDIVGHEVRWGFPWKTSSVDLREVESFDVVPLGRTPRGTTPWSIRWTLSAPDRSWEWDVRSNRGVIGGSGFLSERRRGEWIEALEARRSQAWNEADPDAG